MDRCHQARVRNALEPEWEARFEPRSYGFRPGRSCQDAIGAIYTTCKGPRAKRVWALDADLAAAFDRIDHDRLLAAIGPFPAREMIHDWLKAGVFEPGKGFAPTEEGTPQGGVISPLLLNVALHGLEEAAGVRYATSGSGARETKPGSPALIRYRSRSNTLVSVRQVTQRNAGRKTPGIDGEVALTSQARAEVSVRVHHSIRTWRPRAVKRVYIPKAGDRTKLRPLGIPVIMDRCHQGRVRNALEPEWEARFEPRSYGFRPGRGCHDAIESIYKTTRGRQAKRVWVLDADLAKAFDKIDHDRLLDSIGDFPARGMIIDWLKAGVFEPGKGFAPTEEGTPQGGVVSPLLLNVALHGLEEAAGVRYRTTGTYAGEAMPNSPTLVRYADDMVALCHSQEQAEQVKARLAEWLAPRGLVFNEDKTKIVHLSEGFDFLGFNVRRYRVKLLIKPSEAAERRLRKRLAAEMRALRGSNAMAILAKLNPIIKGWAAYYRSGVSSAIFNALDSHVWRLVYKWAKYTHPKSRNTGSSTSTSGNTTSSGMIGGYSATHAVAPTSPNSPGPPSSGTPWSSAGRHPTTPP